MSRLFVQSKWLPLTTCSPSGRWGFGTCQGEYDSPINTLGLRRASWDNPSCERRRLVLPELSLSQGLLREALEASHPWIFLSLH